MPIPLSTLINRLKASLDAPGVDGYATVSEVEWETRLSNGFWTAYLDGFLQGYTIDTGAAMATPVATMIPQSGTDEIPEDLQQLVVIYTAIDSLRSKLFSFDTLFRAKAGPVEYEVQKSAQVMKALLDQFAEQRRYLLEKLAQSSYSDCTISSIDAFQARQEAIDSRYMYWVDA